MTIEWEEFLDPYIQAVGELKIKLRGIRKQYRKQNKHSPIEFVTGCVKSIESIKEKMARRGITYASKCWCMAKDNRFASLIAAFVKRRANLNFLIITGLSPVFQLQI